MGAVMSGQDLSPPPGEAGLSTAEAQARLAATGANRIVPDARRTGLLLWLLRPFADPMALLLAVAGVTYFVIGDRVDGVIVLAALVPIALVTLVLEARSERALARLRDLTVARVTVWRDGDPRSLPAEAVVPGDLVSLREGDIVPADGAVIAGAQLTVDESALTGESQPVEKSAGADGQVFAGTTVLAGRALARIAVTGTHTRYGRIGRLVAEIRQPRTPLERIVRRLVLGLGVVAGVCCAAVVALQLWRGQGWGAALIAGISLAIAAVPEEFPMVYTLYLSLGAWRLARGKALVRRLAGVETLGSTTVICADKTGTLTLGKLAMERCLTPDGRAFGPEEPLTAEARALLEAAVLASEPRPFDPLEVALLGFAEQAGVEVEALHAGRLISDYPFDPNHRYMSHVWQGAGGLRICAKGALEGILAHSDTPAELRDRVEAEHQDIAASGMRVLAVAEGVLPGPSAGREADETALRFRGLIVFSDPLRPGVVDALAECRAAGIRVVMITGDHPATAHAVADGLGIPHEHGRHLVTGPELDAADPATLGDLARDVAIFARARPEQKYTIVRALRARGEVVAMTGDGINDAPALREADIGVAMGQRGTEVARAAATLVLLDDNFATIVHAVRNGRRIFDNLRTAFSYLVAFHIPLLLTALAVPLVGAPLLLFPVHLIWLELIVHPTASLVFEADPEAPDLMRRPPRSSRQGFLSGTGLWRPIALGAVLGGAVLGLYLGRLARGGSEAEARALAVATLLVGQIGLVLVERAGTRPLWRAPLRGNRMLGWVGAGTLATLGVALYAPSVAAFLHVTALGSRDWLVVMATAAAATLWTEPLKTWRGRPKRA